MEIFHFSFSTLQTFDIFLLLHVQLTNNKRKKEIINEEVNYKERNDE